MVRVLGPATLKHTQPILLFFKQNTVVYWALKPGGKPGRYFSNPQRLSRTGPDHNTVNPADRCPLKLLQKLSCTGSCCAVTSADTSAHVSCHVSFFASSLERGVVLRVLPLSCSLNPADDLFNNRGSNLLLLGLTLGVPLCHQRRGNALSQNKKKQSPQELCMFRVFMHGYLVTSIAVTFTWRSMPFLEWHIQSSKCFHIG